MLLRILHDLAHVVGRFGYKARGMQNGKHLFLNRMLPPFLYLKFFQVFPWFGKKTFAGFPQFNQFFKGVFPHKIQIVYPLGNARDLYDYAPLAHQVGQFAHGKIIAADVDFADNKHAGTVGDFSFQGNLLNIIRDMF